MTSDDGKPSDAVQPANDEHVLQTGLAEPEQDAGTNLLAFPVAGYGLIYDHESPTEYIDKQAIFPIPTDHRNFRGLINRRGSLVPIFEIRPLIDSEQRVPDDASSNIFVLGRGDDAVGILLDAVPYRITVTEQQKTSTPPLLTKAFGGHIKYCYKEGDDFYVNVALDAFLYELRNGAVQT